MAYKNINTIIVNTSIHLFKEYGYQNISINQICNNCSITKPTFYYHFKSKEDILLFHLENTLSSADYSLPEDYSECTGFEKCVAHFNILYELFNNFGIELMKIIISRLSITDITDFGRKCGSKIFLSYISDGRQDLSINNPMSPEQIFTVCLTSFIGFITLTGNICNSDFLETISSLLKTVLVNQYVFS